MSNKIDLKDPILNEHIRLHLQFIQNVITRMNTNSFQIKTVAGTMTGAFLAFMYEKGKELEPYASLALLILIGLFWCLDVYFLSLEQKFRHMYKKITHKIRIDDMYMKDLYDMDIKKVEGTLLSSIKSPSIIIFYLALLILLLVVFAFKTGKIYLLFGTLALVGAILFFWIGYRSIKFKNIKKEFEDKWCNSCDKAIKVGKDASWCPDCGKQLTKFNDKHGKKASKI